MTTSEKAKTEVKAQPQTAAKETTKPKPSSQKSSKMISKTSKKTSSSAKAVSTETTSKTSAKDSHSLKNTTSIMNFAVVMILWCGIMVLMLYDLYVSSMRVKKFKEGVPRDELPKGIQHGSMIAIVLLFCAMFLNQETFDV
jgi:hypothetical protein